MLARKMPGRETMTDMMFLEAQPFEREYSQSQQMGGGGGGGGERGRAGRHPAPERNHRRHVQPDPRQKEGRAAEAENAKFLSEMQAKLRDQSRRLRNV